MMKKEKIENKLIRFLPYGAGKLPRKRKEEKKLN